MTAQRPVARTFWQNPAGWTNVSGQGLHRQGGDGLVDTGRAGEVVVIEPAGAVADGSLGPQLVRRGVRPDEVTVRDPDLVLATQQRPRPAGHDLGVARMAERDVDLGLVVAAGVPGALQDPHPQRRRTAVPRRA